MSKFLNYNGLLTFYYNLKSLLLAKADKTDISELREYIDKQIQSVSGITNSPTGDNFGAFVQNGFNAALGVTTTYTSTQWDYKTILDICKTQGSFQVLIRLGGVDRTVLFQYDSYIYFNAYDPNTPDYYNYFSDITLNDEVFRLRLQIYLDGTLKITKYQLTVKS